MARESDLGALERGHNNFTTCGFLRGVEDRDDVMLVT